MPLYDQIRWWARALQMATRYVDFANGAWGVTDGWMDGSIAREWMDGVLMWDTSSTRKVGVWISLQFACAMHYILDETSHLVRAHIIPSE